MIEVIGLIGFGEAGSAFAIAGGWSFTARVFDIKTVDPATAQSKRCGYQSAGVQGCNSLDDALRDARLVLSLVTANQALGVARAAAAMLRPGAIFCDFNSVAPPTKRAAADAIEAAGGKYVDVAVMAPVDPARLKVPLLLSGAQAEFAKTMLGTLGFSDLRVVGDTVGRASSIKMIRSVIVKGMEALTAECVLAAETAGVLDEVLDSLDASEKPRLWVQRADYNLDRMMTHGLRRAAEMEEVIATLDELGTCAVMTRGTVERQRWIGALALNPLPDGLPVKIAQIRCGELR